MADDRTWGDISGATAVTGPPVLYPQYIVDAGPTFGVSTTGSAEGGVITGVAAGNGLTGGGTAGDVTLSLTVPVSVANGGTGSTSGMGALSSLGAITQVIAGNGLAGGGTSGNVTITLTTPVAIANGGTNATTGFLALDNLSGATTTGFLQRTAGGAWSLVAAGGVGTITGVTAGTGLTGGGTSGVVTVGLTVPVAVANGGTGSTTAASALSNLGGLPLAGGTISGGLTVTGLLNANSLELGPDDGVTTPYVDFHGATTWTDWATRVVRAGGDNGQFSISSRGTGGLNFSSYDAGPFVFGTSNTERMRITPAGNVGIGTASPSTALHVARTSTWNSSFGAFAVTDGASIGKQLTMGYDAALGANGAGFIQTTSAGVAFTNLLLNPGGGNVGIGTLSPGSLLTVNGVCANVSGAWTTISDRSMKENVLPYTRGLDAIIALNPVQFRYIAGSPLARDSEDPLIGLIADEVQPHVPEIVGETTTTVGEKSDVTISTLEPGLLLFALINSVKAIVARLEALEAKYA